MKKIHSYKDLIVWQKAVDLSVSVYKMTELLPRSERYEITSQMKRAAISIPSNIAEGRSRITKKDFNRFLSFAHGSAAELETQIEILKRLSIGATINLYKISSLIDEIKRMLGAMMRKLNPINSLS